MTLPTTDGPEFRSESHLLLGELATTAIRTLTIRIFNRWKLVGDDPECDVFTFKGTDFRFAYPYMIGGTEVTVINPVGDSPVMMQFGKSFYDYRID